MPKVEAVGICTTGKRGIAGIRSAQIHKAMENAVLSCHQQGITDPKLVSAAMREAGKREETLIKGYVAEIRAQGYKYAKDVVRLLRNKLRLSPDG